MSRSCSRSRSYRSYPHALWVMLREDGGALPAFIVDVARACVHDPKALCGELYSWHATVRCWQDPEGIAALLES